MSQFLDGAAKRWFIDFVADQPSKWTVDSIGIGLFNYFFPPQIKSQFRREFETAKQGALPFKHFVQHVQNLAKRLGDISERQIILRIWKGSHYYLREKWSENGYDPELSELKELLITGQRYEIAESITKKYTKKNEIVKDKTFFGSRTVKPQAEYNRSRMKRKPFNNNNNETKPKNTAIKSKDKLNELRSQNKCFICEESGHIARECKQKRLVKPPNKGKINSSNIRFTFIEEENTNDDLTSITVNLIHCPRLRLVPDLLDDILAEEAMFDEEMEEIVEENNDDDEGGVGIDEHLEPQESDDGESDEQENWHSASEGFTHSESEVSKEVQLEVPTAYQEEMMDFISEYRRMEEKRNNPPSDFEINTDDYPYIEYLQDIEMMNDYWESDGEYDKDHYYGDHFFDGLSDSSEARALARSFRYASK